MALSPLAVKLFGDLGRNKTIIAACDAGTKKNGKPDCIAAYGVTIFHHDSIDTLIKFGEEWKKGKKHASLDDSLDIYSYNGLVSKNVYMDGVDWLRRNGLETYNRLDGSAASLKIFDAKEMTPTVNRGEFTALNILLDKIIEECLDGDVVILSDSEYTLNTVDNWSRKWFKDPAGCILCEKENLDLVASTQNKLDNLRKTRKVTLEHIRSHKPAPSIDAEPIEWLKWYMNDRADVLASHALGKK